MKTQTTLLAAALFLGACSNTGQFASNSQDSGLSAAIDNDQSALVATATNDWSNAEALVADADQMAEDSTFRTLNLAYVYQMQGNTEQAVAMYEKNLAQKDNPYAQLPSGKVGRVKTFARRELSELKAN